MERRKLKLHDPMDHPAMYKSIWETVLRSGNELLYPDHRVFDKPGFSVKYCDCNGVAIVNATAIGLSHYLLSDNIPERYIPELLADMNVTGNGEGLAAAVVGGDPSHFNRIKAVLNNHKIPIIGEYLDEWIENAADYYSKFADKKLIVVDPPAHEVIMWSQASGYRVLISNHS